MDDAWASIGQASSEDQEANQSVVVKLLDPSLFDCQICHQPLTIPIFQCDLGDHIACSSCRTEQENRCPFGNGSVGFTRAPLLEKILRSITISCPNNKYGCEEPLAFYNRNEHRNYKCAHSPCLCPFPGCKFVSSAKKLYQHFSGDHPNSGAAQFEYNRKFNVTLRADNKFLVLQEKNNGTLFILVNHVIEGLGNRVMLKCIQPARFEGFCYDVIVKYKELDSLTFDSFTKSTPRHEEVVDGGPPELSFFLVPSYFFGSSGQLKIDLCISCSGIN